MADIYLVNGGVLNGAALGPRRRAALFRNNGDGTFRDVTAAAGLANERWGQGVCAGDVDNDGDSDLYVTNFGANRLYRNRGDGTFEDVAVKTGVAVGGWSTGCAFGDYDRDGWLDLYVARYVDLDLARLPPSPARPTPGATAGASQSARVGRTRRHGRRRTRPAPPSAPIGVSR